MAYLVSAYIVIWTILFFYLFFLNSRQQTLARDLRQLVESQRAGSRE